MPRMSLGVTVPGPGSPRAEAAGEAGVSSSTCYLEPEEWLP